MAENSKGDAPEQRADVFYARLVFEDRGTGLRFARRYGLDVIETAIDDQGRLTLTVLATRKQIEDLRAAGARVEVGENASAVGRERQKEVSTEDRFEGGKIAPKGLGRKVRGDR